MANQNGVLMQYFEWNLKSDASLWKKLSRDATHLKDIGISAVWMPPAFKGAGGINDVGYGVYDVYDLGEFDQKGSIPTKYGTKKDYLKAINALHKHNIDAYADIVLNHMLGADATETVEAVEKNANNRNETISHLEPIRAWTKFDFPGRGGKYSDFHWTSAQFTGVDWDENKHTHAIYNLKDNPWSEGVDAENGNDDYLMGADVNFRSPVVVKQLFDWGDWYCDTTHIDGFRLDAIKHIDNQFYRGWLAHLREKYHREFFAVGEYWSGNVDTLTHYLDACGHTMSLFDVPLHYNLYNASHGHGDYDMRRIFDNTLVSKNPAAAVTFVDNHDTQPGSSLESAVDEWFLPLAYALILLRPQGYPCVFYGDYYGMACRDFRSSSAVIDHLLAARRDRIYGELHDYFDHPDIIGWSLEGDDSHPHSGLAVVLSDRDGGEKTIYVGRHHGGERWMDLLQNQSSSITIKDDGTGVFSCAGGSVSVWGMASS